MLNDLLAKNGSGADKLYVEDVFSTWLYTGTGASQTITNGINLSGKGGLVWTKFRSGSFGSEQHALIDTARGANYYLASDSTAAQVTSYSNVLTAFNSNGYTLGADTSSGKVNYSAQNYASWTFRKAPKFFDVVTWTGNGAARDISHSLGVSPGFIIIKRTDAVAQWPVWHRSLSANNVLFLNQTAATQTVSGYVSAVSSTTFSIGTQGNVNASGGTYVAYLFAHDTTADGVIQCGSLSASSATTVTLGWEPQYVLLKQSSGAQSWYVVDVMRGLSYTNFAFLQSNTVDAEADAGVVIEPTATGFTFKGANLGATSGETYIYMAIRRGPMRTPTDATKVFTPSTRTGASGVTTYIPSAGLSYSPDLLISAVRSNGGGLYYRYAINRLADQWSLQTEATSAEQFGPSNPIATFSGFQNVIKVGAAGEINSGSNGLVDYYFKRAPGFMDCVLYSGTGSTLTVSHNLSVAPELIMIKSRSGAFAWTVGSVYLPDGWSNPLSQILVLNSNAASAQQGYIHTVTSSTFQVAAVNQVGASGSKYVAYLFASCPGVSKIGTYTGNGSSQSINCSFTNGARFVLIKRTDSTGNWNFWDTARGIVAANDPYMWFNVAAAEVTNNDTIDPLSSGFTVNQVTASNANVNGATYIYLAIA